MPKRELTKIKCDDFDKVMSEYYSNPENELAQNEFDGVVDVGDEIIK